MKDLALLGIESNQIHHKEEILPSEKVTISRGTEVLAFNLIFFGWAAYAVWICINIAVWIVLAFFVMNNPFQDEASLFVIIIVGIITLVMTGMVFLAGRGIIKSGFHWPFILPFLTGDRRHDIMTKKNRELEFLETGTSKGSKPYLGPLLLLLGLLVILFGFAILLGTLQVLFSCVISANSLI